MRVPLFAALRSPLLLGEALGARPTLRGMAPPEIRGIATHASEVLKGDLFAALPGTRVSGTAFIGEALGRGAAAVLVPPEAPLPKGDFWVFCVGDVASALLRAASRRRAMTSARVIAISGSVGKTTVKEVVATILSQTASTAKSEGNFNSTLGMPLSLLSMDEAAYFVLELGINHEGEMAPMSRVLQPHVALLTNIGTAHIGHFKSEAALLAEKLQIAAGQRADDLLLLNEEIDIGAYAFLSRVMRAGVLPSSDAVAKNIVCGKGGITLDLTIGEQQIEGLSFPLPGRAGREALTFGATVGLLMGVGEKEIRRGIAEAARALPHRRVFTLSGHLIVDDTYNASPEAMTAALYSFYYVAPDRPRVAVLGDMGELGVHANRLHEWVGEEAAKSGVHTLLLYGKHANDIKIGARRGGISSDRIFLFDFGEEGELCRVIVEKLPTNAAVLFKASRATALDRVVRLLEEGKF